MSNVPTNLIPTRVTGLPEYQGTSTLGYMPYIIDGQTFKVQFANIAAVGAVPSSREINSGSGLGGGGDLSANRTLYILPAGVADSMLTTTGVTAGTYGAADSVPVLTVNAQGRVTAATSAPIVLANYVPTSRTITAGAGLTGGGDLSANRSFAVIFSSTTPEPLGPGSPGVSTAAARGDHVHPAVDLSDTTETQGVLPLSRGGTGNSLSPVVGAIAYSSNDALYLTPTAGTAGQVLVSGGGVAPPFWQTIAGTGTVTSVSVTTANGFAGTVANASTVPALTLSTTVSGLLKGNGTEMLAATAGIDYVAPGAYTTSGLTMATARLLGRTTASVGAAEEITVGNGLTLASGSLVNAAPDQVVALTGGTAISVTGSYPSFTVTNTAPDQVVSLTGAGTTTVTGTYPSFTITSNDSAAGTVTSVNASGGTTGMSFTGGPITSAGTLTLNGTLAIANGGTGATDAVAALTNLGAYPASNPSGFTSNVGTVTSVSGTGTVSGLSLSGTVTSTGSLTLGGTLAVLPSNFASQTANTVLAAPNGSAGTPTFRAIVAADIPTLNQNTTGTASNVTGIVAVANGGTGASVAGTARTNLGAAASGANTDITSIALTTGTISTSPVNGTDIVNKAYADSIASGINFHQSVRLATAAALPANTYNNGTSGVGATLTANANGALTVDGVAAVAGNRILVKNEATQANNGVYTVTQVGNGSTPYILTRATDFDSAGTGVDQIDAGDFFLVTAGSTLANTSWVQQTPLPITVGTTAIVFSQFAAPVLYSAGTGLSLTGTTFSITNTGVSASTYGSASSVPVIAVNAQGQITSASASSIAIAASQITSGALAIANGGTGATSAATALTNLGAYPASNPSGFTSNTGTVTSVNLTAGTGVSVSGGPITASGSITVTNTAPDQVVSLTGSGATTVTGTYPNFTISSPTSGAGTVTSIDVSGGTTGLTTSGGPVTSSGTITLAGTLNVANGGTGATTLSSGYLLKGNGTSAVSASVVYDTGTNVGIGTASPGQKLSVAGNTIVPITNSYFCYTNDYGIGTPDSNGLQVFASNGDVLRFGHRTGGTTFTEDMRIASNGNVGIKTTNPTAPLTVSAASVMSRFQTGTAADGRIEFAYNTTDIGYLNMGSASLLDLTARSGVALAFGAGGSERMRITSAGNVGIGTTTPSTILHVNAGAAFDTNVRLQAGAAGNHAKHTYSNVSNTVMWTSGYQSSTGNFGINVGDSFNATGITINTSGNVGINTTTPSEKIEAFGADASIIVHYSGQSRGGISALSGARIALTTTTSGDDLVFGYAGSPITSAGFVPRMTIDNGTGSITAGVDFRAPIFYDSDNTAFYADMGGTSNFNQINLGDSTKFIRGGGSGQTILGVGSVNDAYLQVGGTYYPIWNSGNFTPGNYLPLTGGTLTGTLTIQNSNDAQLYLNGNGTSWAGIQWTDVSGSDNMWYNGANSTFAIGGGGSNVANKKLHINGGTTIGSGIAATAVATNGLLIEGALNAGNGNLTPAGTTFSNVLTGRGTNRVVAFDGNGTVPSVWWTNGGTAIGAIDAISGGGLAHWANNGSSWQQQMAVNYGNVTINTDIRSPIFYDSNNTAYYVDPASTSVLNVMRANTLQFSSGNQAADLNNASYFILRDPTANAAIYLGGADPANYYDNTTHWFRTRGGSNMAVMNSNGIQAPIFYDISNTAYYGDFAGTSNIFNLTISGTGNKYLVIQSTDSGEAMVRYLGATGPSWYVGKRTTSQLVDTASFHFYSESAGATVGGIDVSGNMFASTSFRAPIFYDNNNTAYYIDGAASSSLSSLLIGYNGSTLAYNDGATGKLYFGSLGGDASTNYHITTNMENVGGNYSKLDFKWYTGQRFYTHYAYGGVRFKEITTGNTLFSVGESDLRVRVYDSISAPIYYDSSNTAYYFDGASTSNWNTSGQQGFHTFGNYGLGIVGTYSPTRYQLVWALGDAYKGNADGTSLTSAYGLWFSYPSAGGPAANLSTHGLMLIQNGSFMASLDPSMRAVTDMRAPIFYDYNNTAFFVDPNSTSVLSVVRAATIQQSSGNTAIILDSGTWTQFCDPNGAVKLWLGGTGDPNNYYNANIHYFRNTSSATSMTIDSSGNVVATANVTAYSDARLKKDVVTIDNALGLVGKMRGVTYTRKDTGEAGVGVIAQEMLEVMPQAVHQGTGDNDTLSVAYGNLVGVLIEAIKELTARVAELEGK